jgi:phosphopantothenoylcysteine decarboxylase/phosphopantothenate--cysteine ligase
MLDPLELLPDQRIGHIVAADSCDVIVIAPATARWLAAMAAGLADDVITATCIASSAPVIVCPAMDGDMWRHPATVRNIETLRGFGYTIVEPESGPLASGQSGVGRLAETQTILAALDRGAQVTLIAGMISAPIPSGVDLVRAPSAAEMRDAVLAALPQADALIMAAAVADFRPRTTSATKIARDGAGLTLELEPTSDILAEAVQTTRTFTGRRPVIVGFAAETGSLERAPAKAARKGVDLMVANDVADEGSGFGTDTNTVTIIEPNGPPDAWPIMSKRQVADRLFDRIIGLRAAKGAELAAE